MLNAAGHCIPHVGMQTNAWWDGWNDECKRLKEQSLLLWVDSDRPNIGVVADTMRLTRRRYHLAVRHLMREQNNKRNAKLADLYMSGIVVEISGKKSSARTAITLFLGSLLMATPPLNP